MLGFNFSIEILDEYNNQFNYFQNSRPYSSNYQVKNTAGFSLSPSYVLRTFTNKKVALQYNIGITTNGYRYKRQSTVAETKARLFDFYLSNNIAALIKIHKKFKLKVGGRGSLFLLGWRRTKTDVNIESLQFNTQQSGQVLNPGGSTQTFEFDESWHSEIIHYRNRQSQRLFEVAANLGFVIPLNKLEISFDMHHGILPYSTTNSTEKTTKLYYRSISVGINYFTYRK